MKHYIYILAIISCLASCTPHSKHWETLMQVESFIEERPDSALAVLQGMDKEALSGKEEEAKHALLLSMALDKNVIDRTDNEVIQNCYVGRSTYYRMKRGELINVDAYIRLTDYAVLKIRVRMERWLLPHDFMKEWRKKIMGVLGF